MVTILHKIVAFTVRALKESLQLCQKDFIMRLVVFLKKIMVSAGVSMHGKTCIIFIDPQITKVNGEYYVGLLHDKLIPECRRLYPDDSYIFQQASAPSHRCRLAQQFLQANTPDFIHNDAWPPNSPDLNPLDYYVWNALEE